ncbi:MAG: PAS domain S-box protein [Methanomassiliicoccales archaeon]
MVRVLCVDDEQDVLELTKAFLEEKGNVQVVTCLSAIEALRLLETTEFTAIISDYQMPEMDGLSLLKEVREKWPNLPFILFTGRGREEVAIDAYKNGADSYVMKGGDARAQYEMLAHELNLALAKRHAETELRKRYKRFNLFMQNISDIIFMVSATGRIIYVSPAILSVLGYSRKELEGMDLEEIRKMLLTGSPHHQNAMELLLEAEQNCGSFLKAKAKDGSVRLFHIKTKIVEESEGKMFIAIAKDITHITTVESELRLRDNLFSTLLDYMPFPSGITRAKDGRIIHVNRSVENIMGYRKEDVIGKTTVEVGLWDAEKRSQVLSQLPPGKMMRGVQMDLRMVDGSRGVFTVDIMRIAMNDMKDEQFFFFMIRSRVS